jgi:hypothetical protein
VRSDDKQRLYKDVEEATRCPRCFAKLKEPCMDLRYKGKHHIERPHEERLDVFFGR